MAEASFILNGNNVLAEPAFLGGSSRDRTHRASRIVRSGRILFLPGQTIELLADNVTAHGEITAATVFTGLNVYANAADYLGGSPRYQYGLANPQQPVNICSDSAALGQSYVLVDAGGLRCCDPGAPALGQLLLASDIDLTPVPNGVPVKLPGTPGDHNASIQPTAQPAISADTDCDTAIPGSFARGTLIETDGGPVPVESLREGDLLRVLDGSLKPVRWIRSQTVDGTGRDAPVRIAAGALCNRRDLLVSQSHRILLSGPMAELLFGDSQLMVAAGDLIDGAEIQLSACAQIEYFHILMDGHQVLFAEGCPVETAHPSEPALQSLDRKTRRELRDLFPDRRYPAFPGGLSRRALSMIEARAWQLFDAATSPAARGVSLRTAAHSLRHRPLRAAS